MGADSPPELGQIVNLIADETGRQIQSAGLSRSLARAVSGQLAESGVVRDSPKPSPFGLLTAFSYEAAGGADWSVAGTGAAAIQFLIAAGDALDDIQDGDPVSGLRSQDPAKQTELVATLIALSHLAITSLDTRHVGSKRVLSAGSTLARLAVAALSGQNSDVSTRASDRSTVEMAEAIVAAKSGSLGRAAAETGARLATLDADLIGLTGEFGQEWAFVVQAVNDVTGVWPGGAASSDISRERITVPIALGLDVHHSHESAKLEELIRGAAQNAGSEQEARRLLWESGAVHKAWALAGLHHARAMRLAKEISSRNRGSRLGLMLAN